MSCRTVWPVGALLGEGPIWIDEDAALWFVDIKGGRIHRYDPAADERRTFEVGGQPSFVVPAQGGGLIVGRGHDLMAFRDGRLQASLATLDMPAGNRTNDATVDPAGRLWFGTMDDGESSPTGAFYVCDAGGPRKAGGSIVITNGPAVSPDGRTLYCVDTLARDIRRHDVSQGVALGEGEPFALIDPKDGNPDGVTIDAEGCLWVALWGGWGVRRYSPEGDVLGFVEIPCANATKVAFGGPDLKTAYVTSARIGLSDRNAADQPLAGGLFAFDAPAPGLPAPLARMAPPR